MSEVASAYVSLLPSARGFGRNLEGEVGSDIKRSGGRLGGLLGKSLKAGAVGIAAAAGGTIGAALFKGFDRLKGIDQAKAKLKGLGHSAKSVDKIMTNALSSVKGTAFGLDEAATTAATAVAAGIKPGKELSKYLTLVGDAATISGVSMAEMGRVMNKARTLGGAYNDTLQTLAERGLPVYSLLSKEMGVSTSEVKKLASEGKVSAEILENALRNNIGGAALDSGKTFQGALANMRAALGRLGASFLEGTFSKLPGLFSNITGYLDALGPSVERAAAKMGELASIGWGGLQGLGEILRPLATEAGDLAAVGWGKITRGIESLKGLKNLDFSSIDGHKLGKQLGTAVADGLAAIGKMAGKLTEKFGELMGKVDWVSVGVQIGKQVPAMLLGLAAGILAFDLGSLLEGAKNNWSTILIGILTVAFAPAKLIGPIAKILGKIPFVGRFLAAALVWLNQLGGKLTKFGGDLMKVMWRGFTKIPLPGAGIVAKVIGALRGIPGRVREFFALLGTRLGVWALDAFEAIGRGARRASGGLLKFVGSIPGRILRALAGLVRLLSPRGYEMLAGLARGAANGFSRVAGVLKGVPGKIQSWFSGAASWLLSAGQNVMAGLRNGISSAASSAIDAARAAASRIKDAVTGFFKIKSPSRVMAEIGQWIPKGLAKGITAGAPAAVKAAESVAKRVKASIQKQIDGFKSLRDAVKQAYSPDLFSATPAMFGAGLKTQLAVNRTVLSAVKKLKGMKLNPAFLGGLIQSGNTDLITALAGASSSAVKAQQSDWLAVQQTANQLGNRSAAAVTGKGLGELRAELRKLNRAVSRLPKETGREVSRGVNRSASNGRRSRR